ncbi:hypothetical protein D3C80_1631240 [compost metagenome]
MITQHQRAAMAFGGPACDGQAQAMAGGGLAWRTVERLAQLPQVFGLHARPVVAHADQDPVALARRAHFDRLPGRIEALGVAQQVVHRSLDHGWPALEGQVRLGFELHGLFR